MDLLTHMFDRNPQTLANYQRIKHNDPDFPHITIAISKNPRNDKRSICAAADIVALGREIGKNNALITLSLDDLYCLDNSDVVLTNHMFGMLAPLKELCFIEAARDDDIVVAFVEVFQKKPRLVPIKLQFAAYVN